MYHHNEDPIDLDPPLFLLDDEIGFADAQLDDWLLPPIASTSISKDDIAVSPLIDVLDTLEALKSVHEHHASSKFKGKPAKHGKAPGSKACDSCHFRRVKCIIPSGAQFCQECDKRDMPCIFSPAAPRKPLSLCLNDVLASGT